MIFKTSSRQAEYMKKTYEELEKVCYLQISKHPMGICIYKKIDRPRNHDNSDNLCETLRERTRDYNDRNCPRKKERKNQYYNIDPWVQGLQLDRTTRCHFMSDTQLIRSDWFHPLIKSYRPNTPLTKQRNQKTPTYFTKESKQRIHLNDMTFPLTVSQ